MNTRSMLLLPAKATAALLAGTLSLSLAMTLLPLSTLSAQAATPPDEADWRAFNLATIKHHVLPRYQRLATAAAEMKDRSAALCQQTDEEHLRIAREAFHGTMDAWQGIQHLRTGPVETQMRNYSMQFWPDEKNHVGRNLSELLASKDPKLLNTDEFYSLSVSMPGLPAMERLLFSDNTLQRLQDEPFRCQVAARFAAYVDEMATGMLEEWRGQRLAAYQSAGGEDSLFASNEEAAVELLKPLVEQPEYMRDSKILHPLGETAEDARVRRLESWRSERSLDNLQLNVKALEALYVGEEPEENPHNLKAMTPDETAEEMSERFRKLRTLLHGIEGPLADTLDQPSTHASLMTVASELKTLRESMEELMNTLDIYLGFNSRDGD